MTWRVVESLEKLPSYGHTSKRVNASFMLLKRWYLQFYPKVKIIQLEHSYKWMNVKEIWRLQLISMKLVWGELPEILIQNYWILVLKLDISMIGVAFRQNQWPVICKIWRGNGVFIWYIRKDTFVCLKFTLYKH